MAARGQWAAAPALQRARGPIRRAPLRRGRGSIYAGGDFLSPETYSRRSLREFKWNDLPPYPSPRPLPPEFRLALWPGLGSAPVAVAGLGASGPSPWKVCRLLE